MLPGFGPSSPEAGLLGDKNRLYSRVGQSMGPFPVGSLFCWVIARLVQGLPHIPHPPARPPCLPQRGLPCSCFPWSSVLRHHWTPTLTPSPCADHPPCPSPGLRGYSVGPCSATTWLLPQSQTPTHSFSCGTLRKILQPCALPALVQLLLFPTHPLTPRTAPRGLSFQNSLASGVHIGLQPQPRPPAPHPEGQSPSSSLLT